MCENIFSDGQWRQKLKCLRMPGPQGPEANKKTEGDQPTVVSSTGNNATETGPEDPARTSPIDDPNPNSSPSNSSATPQTATASGAGSARTVNTSTEAPRRVGFRYYRDLGQN